jgi:hypothetical protein
MLFQLGIHFCKFDIYMWIPDSSLTSDEQCVLSILESSESIDGKYGSQQFRKACMITFNNVDTTQIGIARLHGYNFTYIYLSIAIFVATIIVSQIPRFTTKKIRRSLVCKYN